MDTLNGDEMDVHFRPATEKDVPALLWLIQVSVAKLLVPHC